MEVVQDMESESGSSRGNIDIDEDADDLVSLLSANGSWSLSNIGPQSRGVGYSEGESSGAAYRSHRKAPPTKMARRSLEGNENVAQMSTKTAMELKTVMDIGCPIFLSG
jgi:hypothetical protein